MKKITAIAIAALALMMPATANAQFNLSKAINAGAKAAKAITLTDKQMADYVKEYIDWMDKNNPVLPDDDHTPEQTHRRFDRSRRSAAQLQGL